MKATPLEYRLRYALHTLVFVLGFWAPWNPLLHLGAAGPNAHLWGVLSALLAKNGILGIAPAFDTLLCVGIVFSVAGAWLRTWGAAYLGATVVQHSTMQAAVVADGPFRRLRNPLYLGTFLYTLALALLMSATGAIFTVVVIALMQVRLALAEEAFLTRTLGAPYLAYKALVPRWLPSLRPRVAPSGRAPRWPQAFLAEINIWGAAFAFAFLGWRYNATLLIQAVVISFGLSLLVRALPTKPLQQQATG